jgi:AhpD family alkylhydroperoxidase
MLEPQESPAELAVTHEVRLDYRTIAPDAVRAQMALETYVRRSSLEPSLRELIKLLASYINGCAYCVDMHSRDALAAGESQQRLFAVPVWREAPFFTPRERAALEYTEAATLIAAKGISDDVFDHVREHFTDGEVVDLIMAVNTISGWNRLAITCRPAIDTHAAATH